MKEGWEYKKLSDLFDITSSKRVFQSDWKSFGVPFYRAREIVQLSKNGYVDNELFITEELYTEYIKKYGKPQIGDIMVTGVGTLGICYLVKPNDKFYFKDGNIIWMKKKTNNLSEYIEYAFKSFFVKNQVNNSSGATVGTYTIIRANQTIVPIPQSIDTQKYIVEELDLLSSIIEKKKAQLKELDNLAQSLFYEMFGDPITNEKGWKVKKLKDCCKNYDSQRKPITAKDRIKGSIPYYGASGVVDYVRDFIFDGDFLLVSEDGANLVLRSTPIAFCIKGKTWVNNHAHVLKFDTLFQQKYIEFSINLRDISMMVTGCAQPKLTQAALNNMIILYPPLSLQQQFASKIEAIEHQKELIKQSIKEVETLFNSRMDYYFN